MKRIAAATAAALVLAGCTDRAPTGVAPAPAAAPRPDPHLEVRAGRDGPHVAGRVVVRFRPGAARSEVAMQHSARVRRDLALERVVILDVAAGAEAETAERLARHPGVEWAEPDYVVQLVPCEVGICAETNDSFRGYKWDLHNPGEIRVGSTVVTRTGAADADIDWQEMYDHLGPGFTGSATIGIIDSGIRRTHSDLLGRVVAERNFVVADSAARGNADDDNSHGTHVAGIAAARGNNGLGLMGVGYGANIRLMALKACTAEGSCPSSATAEAITWAVDHGADVVNLSLSTFGGSAGGSSLQRAALQYAVSRNVLPVCATGNDARKTDPAVHAPVYRGGIGFPARFPECLAVGATDWNDGWAPYSNWGPGIDLVAPGGDSGPVGAAGILSTGLSTTNPASNGTYTWKNGTSMAAPQVSGLAAILFAMGMTDAQAVRQRIVESADDLGPPGWDERFGWGRINAYRAVTGEDPSAPPVVETGGAYAGVEGAPVRFDGTASADPNGKEIAFAWSFGDGRTSTEAAPTHVYADDGEYTVTLRVTDASGRATVGTTTARIANAAPEVSVALGAGSLVSGESTSLAGRFSDAGTDDGPWSWAVDWGERRTGGVAATQSVPVEGSHRFCAVGTRTVRLAVTDKDGAVGEAAAELTVVPIAATVRGPGALNGRAAGRLPVAILTTASVAADEVDVATVSLGGAAVARRQNGTPMASREDVDGDGDPDLVLHFERAELSAASGLVLVATLSDGCREIRGAVANAAR